MARHTPECDRMIAAFAAANLPLYIAYYRRALPRFVELKQLLDSHALGPLTNLHLRFSQRPRPTHDEAWRVDAATAGGGDFLDLASHALDLCDWLFGPLQGGAGHAAKLGPASSPVEDSVALTFHTPTGVPATAQWNFAANAHEDRFELTGTEGRITCSVFGDEPLELIHGDQTKTISRPNPLHVQQPLIQTVVDDLLGRGTCPSTGASARRTTVLMDQVLGAYYGGRDDAFWERPATWPGRIRA